MITTKDIYVRMAQELGTFYWSTDRPICQIIDNPKEKEWQTIDLHRFATQRLLTFNYN